MFGYIRPVESELLVKEYEFYRAVYCSLCKTGGRRVSRFSRFFLNYDFVFLALVRLALTREQVSTERTFCPYRLKKKTVLAENDAVTYTTAAFGLLSYYKLCDDIADLRGFRRLKKRLLLPLFSRMRRKAARLYPELDRQVAAAMEAFSIAENKAGSAVDQAADGFAAITRILASCGLEGEAKDVAEVCGYHLGRFIYIIDAFDDCREDDRRSEYNCLNSRYGSAEATETHAEQVLLTLKDSMAAFSRAYALADGCPLDNLIYNVATLGGEAAFRKIMQVRKDTMNGSV